MAQIIKFPTSYKTAATCKEAFFVKDDIWFELLLCRPEELDEIMKDHKKRNLRGFPLYYDRSGRIWPNEYGKIIYR